MPESVELSVRYEALQWAARQFGKAFLDVGDAARGVTAACRLAAGSAGDAGASAAVTSAGQRMAGILDTVSSRLLDIGGGLEWAVSTYQMADDSAAGEYRPERPGRPS